MPLPAVPLWGQGVLSLPQPIQPIRCSKQVSSAAALQAESLAFFSTAGLGTPSQRPSAPVGPATTPAWLGGALGSVARHHLCSAMQPSRVTQHSLPLLAGAYNSSFLAKALPFTRNEVKASGQVGGRGKQTPSFGLVKLPQPEALHADLPPLLLREPQQYGTCSASPLPCSEVIRSLQSQESEGVTPTPWA